MKERLFIISQYLLPHHLLSRLAGHAPFSDWQAPDYQPVQLLQRHCLNPGSSASPAFQLRLQIPPGSHWQAGDILEVGPGKALSGFVKKTLGADVHCTAVETAEELEAFLTSWKEAQA